MPDDTDTIESPAEVMLRRIGLLDRLVVTTVGPDVIVVDAQPVMSDPTSQTEPRFWRLHEADGVWHHPQSGNRGNLGHMLRAIAWSYDDGVAHGLG